MAAAKTSALLKAAYEEYVAYGGGPAIFAMDFNALPEHVPFAGILLYDLRWTDVGAVGAQFGAKDHLPTCLAGPPARPTRSSTHPPIPCFPTVLQIPWWILLCESIPLFENTPRETRLKFE